MTFDEFLAQRACDRRLARLTHDIPLPEARGLEFGAADNPTPLPERVSVLHVDRAVDANGGIPNAVNVDRVWSGNGAFPGSEGGFDFAIAAQVAQYVPNLLGWFDGIHAILRPGGVLNLSLPDRRFMFDLRRAPSSLGQLLDAFYGRYERPSPGQAFDHTYGAVAVETRQLWTEPFDVAALPRYCGEHALALAAEASRRARDGEPVPCHCWVFTPFSFLEIFAGAARMGLFRFVISEFASTDPGDNEFFVCLRRDREDDPERLLAMQLGAFEHVRAIAERRRRTAIALARE